MKKNYNFIDQVTFEELRIIISNYVNANSINLTGKKIEEIKNEDIELSVTIDSQQSRKVTVLASIENLKISIVLTDYFASLTYGNAESDTKFEDYWLACLAKKFPYKYVDAYKAHYLAKYSKEYDQKRIALDSDCYNLEITSPSREAAEHVDDDKAHYLAKYSKEYDQKRIALFEKCNKLITISHESKEEKVDGINQG